MPELSTLDLSGDANLRAYWKLEDVADETVNNYDLTNNNSATFTAAKFNNGVNFTAANTNKSLTRNSDLGIQGGAHSVNFWVKNLAEISSGIYFLYCHMDASTFVQTGVFYEYNSGTPRLNFRRLKLNVGTEAVVHNLTMGTSDFYMLTYVYNATNITAYVNGVQVETPVSASGNGITAAVDKVAIGAGFDGTGALGSYASSLIDDVAVFNRALTADEVASIYGSSFYGNPIFFSSGGLGVA